MKVRLLSGLGSLVKVLKASDEIRHRTAAMREDDPNLRVTPRRSAGDHAHNGTSCIRAVLDLCRGNIRQKIRATRIRCWMNEQDGFLLVEFFQNWSEEWIAHPLYP